MSALRDVPIVCIVDDDASLRRALALLLRGHDFAVEAYGRTEPFLRRLQAGGRPWSVLLLDVHLGAVSGFDLYGRLMASGVAIPTIFMTGRDNPRTRERVSRLGVAGYLVKPFEPAVLLSTIGMALAER